VTGWRRALRPEREADPEPSKPSGAGAGLVVGWVGAHAGRLLGLFGVAFSLPGVLLGPVSGTIIDRLGPKLALTIAKVIGVAAALLLLQADDYSTLTLLCVLHGISSSLSHPALQSMPPRLVDDQHLARTNALVSLTDEVAIIFGPVVAGVGIALFGFRGAFVFDALTYALGLVVLPLVHLAPIDRSSTVGAADDEPVRLRHALEGWRLIVRTGVLRRVVTCTFVVHLLYGAALLAEPLYVRDTFGAPRASSPRCRPSSACASSLAACWPPGSGSAWLPSGGWPSASGRPASPPSSTSARRWSAWPSWAWPCGAWRRP
jgi:MFS family permease